MTTLNRSDGLQFVVQAYRELLPMASRAHLIREIRKLSEQHGNYVYLRQKETREIEAVFSCETGYLLGESIWNFFDRPDHLIYIEKLPEQDQVLLIAVRNNSVHIDAKISEKDLQEELLPLMTGDQAYILRVHGELSLKFPDPLTASFEQIPNSAYQQISADPNFSLSPLTFALKSPVLGKNHVPVLIVGVILVGLLAGYSVFHSGRPVMVSVPHLASAPNPYADYEKALSTSEPAEQLANFVEIIKDLYFIPGWAVSGLKMQNGEYQIELESKGGNVETLLAWSKENHFDLSITGQNVLLKQKMSLKNRPMPANIYSLNQVVGLLVDELDELLDDKVVELGQAEDHGEASVTPMKINLTNTTPEVIDLLGKEIENLPLELKSVDISFKDGLIDGYIQFAVWGRKNANG